MGDTKSSLGADWVEVTTSASTKITTNYRKQKVMGYPLSPFEWTVIGRKLVVAHRYELQHCPDGEEWVAHLLDFGL